ncbi:MAG: M23 family metallopeptidase [Rhodospirillales bacterium]|nr:M23 family metallopeptidase [Rhodospirillales bacterium]
MSDQKQQAPEIESAGKPPVIEVVAPLSAKTALNDAAAPAGGQTSFKQLGPLQQLIAMLFMALTGMMGEEEMDNGPLTGIFASIMGFGDDEQGKAAFKQWHTAESANWKENFDFGKGFDFSRAGELVTSPLGNVPPSGDPDFDRAIKYVLKEEGGLNLNEPNGGIAKFGINSNANPDVDVANLTAKDAIGFYKERYWDKMMNDAEKAGIALDHNEALVAFDAYVNQGQGYGKRMLTETGGNLDKMFDHRQERYNATGHENIAAIRLPHLREEITSNKEWTAIADNRDHNGILVGKPVDDIRISDSYHVRDHHPTRGGSAMHRGIDMATPKGTELHATEDAQVAYAGHSNGYGNIVVLHHGEGVYSMYAHLDRDTVKTGDIVRQGETFAYTGNSGIGTGAHLHHEIWIQKGDAAYTVDPQKAWGKNLSDPAVRDGLIADSQQIAGGYDIRSKAFNARVAADYRDGGTHDHTTSVAFNDAVEGPKVGQVAEPETPGRAPAARNDDNFNLTA